MVNKGIKKFPYMYSLINNETWEKQRQRQVSYVENKPAHRIYNSMKRNFQALMFDYPLIQGKLLIICTKF